MKLHLPLGLLAALLAATPFAQAEKLPDKVFIREDVDITNYWTVDEGSGWIKLDLRRALGLENGLERDTTWIVNFIVKDTTHLISFGSSQESDVYEMGDEFYVTITPSSLDYGGGGGILYNGYGWRRGASPGSTSVSGSLYPDDGYVLVWNPDGLLREDKYGDVRNKVAFFRKGHLDDGKDGFWYKTAGAGSIGPDPSWTGLDVLWANGGDISDPNHIDWLEVKVSYSYKVGHVEDMYVVGGAGELKGETNGGQNNGGPGLYALFSTSPSDPDAETAETIVADQYGVGDEGETVAQLYGESSSRINRLRFVAAGTERKFEAKPDRANYKNDKAYNEALEAYEAAQEGNKTVGSAGEVTADFAMYLGGIYVCKNTGAYTLVAPGFTFTEPNPTDPEAKPIITLEEGGSSAFTLRAVDTENEDGNLVEGFIDWGDNGFFSDEKNAYLHLLEVASGRKLVLDGKGKGSVGFEIRGGGVVQITDKTSLGSTYGERVKKSITVTGGSTLDLAGYDPTDQEESGVWSITMDGGSLSHAEKLGESGRGVEVSVKSGSNDLGGLDGKYLKSIQHSYPDNFSAPPEDEDDDPEPPTPLPTRVTGIGNDSTITFTNRNFSFLVGSSNLGWTYQGARPVGGNYLLSFSGSGHLQFDNDNSQINIYLTDEVVEEIQSGRADGYVDLWLSNGSFDGDFANVAGMDDAELQEWFENHFAFKQYEFIGEYQPGDEPVINNVENFWSIADVVSSGNGTTRDGGILRLLVNVEDAGIWLSSLYGDASASTLSNGKWTSVRVNRDMKIMFNGGENAPTNLTLRDLSSGDSGSGTLTIVDERKLEDESQVGSPLTVTIRQSEDPVIAEWGLGGLVVRDANIAIVKDGAGVLHIAGDLNSSGEVRVSEGSLIVDGMGSKINTLGDFGNGAALEINGMLDVEGSSTPGGNGTISGRGILRVKDRLDLGTNELDNVAVWLDKKDGEEDAPYATLVLSGSHKVSGLIGGEQGVGGTVEFNDGSLTITNAERDFGWTDFNGSFEGSGRIIIDGEAVDQGLYSGGQQENQSVGLEVLKGHLTLIGKEVVGKEVNTEQTSDDNREQIARYGNVIIGGEDGEAGTLTVTAQGFGKEFVAVTQLQAGQLEVREGGKLEILYNLATSDGKLNDPHVGVGAAVKADVDWNRDATLVLGTLGDNPFALGNPKDLEDFLIVDASSFTGGLQDGDKVNLELEGSFLFCWKDLEATYKEDVKGRSGIVLNGKANHDNVFLSVAGDQNNSLAGAEMLWEARKSDAMTTNSSLLHVMEWIAKESQTPDNTEKTSKALAAVAGSTVPILGTAQREALRSQMLRMRDRSGMMGLNEDYTYESMPFTHFWVEATGDFTDAQDGGTYESGFTYNAWGGTVGLEMDVDETVSIAAGVTALYGDLDGGCADTVDGKLDSYYLSLMGRFSKGRWGHTLVGVLGLNQAKLNRTVNYEEGSYRTNGSTSGWVAGLMYEITRDIPLQTETTRVLQPLLGLSIMKTNMGGYNESGADGQGVGLNVGDQDWVTATLTVGARFIASVGEEAFNRAAQMELRANVAQDFGDSQGEADVALQASPNLSRTIRAAEIGKTALQLGASLRVPISDQTLLYFNAGSDFRSGLNSWNLSVGARYNF